MKQWHSPISDPEAARRAGGRRRYNKERQIKAIRRQVQALNLSFHTQLSQVEIARRLGVSRVTVWRYLKAEKFSPDNLHVKRAHGLVFEWPKGWRAIGYWY